MNKQKKKRKQMTGSTLKGWAGTGRGTDQEGLWGLWALRSNCTAANEPKWKANSPWVSCVWQGSQHISLQLWYQMSSVVFFHVSLRAPLLKAPLLLSHPWTQQARWTPRGAWALSLTSHWAAFCSLENLIKAPVVPQSQSKAARSTGHTQANSPCTASLYQ